MHFTFFLVGFLAFITERSLASYTQGDPNGGSQLGGEGAPMFMHMHAPLMYSAPLVAAAPASIGGQYGKNSQSSRVRNLVGSYSTEQGHHTDLLLELPLRRARARKLAARRAARMRKNLKKHHKFNNH